MSSQGIKQLTERSMWCKALDKVEILTQNYKSDEYRSNSDVSALEDVVKSLAMTVKSLETQTSLEQETNVDIIRYLTETFRCLRNACAGCSRNQTHLGGSDCVASTFELLHFVHKKSRSEIETLLKCSLQFIGNFCVGNPPNQKIVCETFLKVFRHLLYSTNDDIVNYTCMVLHNCLLPGETDKGRQLPHHLSFTDDNFAAVVCTAVQAAVHRDLEWGLFVIEDLLQISNFCKMFFEKFSVMERLFVVEVLIVMLKKLDSEEGTRQAVAIDNLQYLTTDLKTQSLQILQAGVSDSDHSQALLLVKILEAVGEATSMHSLYGNFQEDTELLVSSINLLHGVHSIGREGSNHFTSVEKMTETDRIDSDHPAYGLKRDLIRLIGNMVYRHKGNQDKVREMDGIALILDQSNMDGRNPYISQWVVLAVRNLLENNEDNKRYLAGLRLEGLSNNVEMLQEFGISAEVRGDKVVVKRSDDHSEK